MSRYDVTVIRDGPWWMVDIPAIGRVTQARSLDEVEQAARECIAVTLDVPLDEVRVDVREPSS